MSFSLLICDQVVTKKKSWRVSLEDKITPNWDRGYRVQAREQPQLPPDERFEWNWNPPSSSSVSLIPTPSLLLFSLSRSLSTTCGVDPHYPPTNQPTNHWFLVPTDARSQTRANTHARHAHIMQTRSKLRSETKGYTYTHTHTHTHIVLNSFDKNEIYIKIASLCELDSIPSPTLQKAYFRTGMNNPDFPYY